MSEDISATRRRFLRGGALWAAPIAAAASASAVALADDPLRARVTALEDEAAVRALHQSWLRQVNSAEGDTRLDCRVSRISAPHAGAADRIEFAADGHSAVGHFDCAVELETPLAEDCTLAQMAHAQGHGTVRRTERRTLRVTYAKTGLGWRIGHIGWDRI